MSKGRDRTVYRRDDGKWANKRNDAGRASSLHGTQRGALGAGKNMLQNPGWWRTHHQGPQWAHPEQGYHCSG